MIKNAYVTGTQDLFDETDFNVYSERYIHKASVRALKLQVPVTLRKTTSYILGDVGDYLVVSDLEGEDILTEQEFFRLYEKKRD